MADDTDTAQRSPLRTGMDTGELDRTDRILLGTCAAVWLGALGAGVAATVALVDLGTEHAQSTGESETPWLLYVVIAISAAVIIGAVPLLLRARRAALEESPPAARATPVRAVTGQQSPPVRGAEAPTEKLRVPATAVLHRQAAHKGAMASTALSMDRWMVWLAAAPAAVGPVPAGAVAAAPADPWC